jgi:ABC-type spermidine/putrescine transport system permease subunit I
MVSQFYVMQDWPFGSAIAGLLSFTLLVALWLQNRWAQHARLGEFANG